MLLLLKLSLVPASILLASLAARRFGHAISGVLSGLPLIAAPVTGGLLIDLDPAHVAAIGSATLASVPAAVAHIVAFAWLSRRLPGWACLAGAALAFATIGWIVTAPSWPLPPPVSIAAPLLALAIMPRAPWLAGGVHVPRGEIAMRVAAALALAAIILLGADTLPARVSGLLLAFPITGSILPTFTLPAYGYPATVNLLRGFANGLIGFSVFFLALPALLGAGASKPLAFAASLAAAVLAAWLVHRVRDAAARRQQRA
ncbi:MAG: hypothetical protein M9907_17590 [Burkholderiaceae bacterium]|nr:hypothetical protein [Burkholderiaceae bacterium]